MPIFSSCCETSNKHANAREDDPGLGAGGCHLEVLGEATAAVEPSEGSFNHPPLRLGLEGPHTLRPGAHLDGPRAEIRDGIEQLGATVDAIGKDVPQMGNACPSDFNNATAP